MTTPEVAKDIFKEVQAAFPQIVGAPNDDDVKRITKAFINALQSIDVPGGAIDLSDLLLSDKEHEAKHGVGSVFGRMSIPLSPLRRQHRLQCHKRRPRESRAPVDGQNGAPDPHQDS